MEFQKGEKDRTTQVCCWWSEMQEGCRQDRARDGRPEELGTLGLDADGKLPEESCGRAAGKHRTPCDPDVASPDGGWHLAANPPAPARATRGAAEPIPTGRDLWGASQPERRPPRWRFLSPASGGFSGAARPPPLRRLRNPLPTSLA